MRRSRSLILFLASVTASCAEAPFVDIGQTQTMPVIEKPKDPVRTSGTVAICYAGNTPRAEVDALASERCAAVGLKALLAEDTKWQCRFTTPHRAVYRCFDPAMLDERGNPINPLDPNAVREWEKRTGKTAVPRGGMTGPQVEMPAPPTTTPAIPGAPPPPSPAPLSSAPPNPSMGPADIAGKPPMPDQPLPVPAAATPAPAPAGSDFTLPVGSWGDHFQE